MIDVLRQVFRESAVMFWRLAPYVIAGALLGALVARSVRIRDFVARRSSGGAGSVVAAALLGTVSPLCTIGTVPVIAGLMERGLPVSTAAAFLGGSSMSNPQLFLLTAGTLGLPLAICQWAASAGTGITLGFLARRMPGRFPAPAHAVSKSLDDTPRPERHCAAGSRRFSREFLRQLDRVGVYLAVGVVLAALIQVLIPSAAVGRWLGSSPSVAVVVAALISAPFYVCGGGALPAMAVLMGKGVPAGAVVAFFVAGPATRIQALAALASVVRIRIVVLYVAVVLAWAIGTGLMVNRFL